MNELRDNHGNVVQARDIQTVNFGTGPQTALDGLPPATTTFTGRDNELAELASATGLVVVSGMPGVGKTELVLHFAAGRDFPGGRLFWNFHGYDDDLRTSPDQALEAFLRALGVEIVPPTEHDRTTRYRSLLAAREPMIIVLDNANLAAQVRPFLVPKHLVVVTSRDRLSSLEGAHAIPLGVLPPEEAATIVGSPEIARLCGHLPIALQIMAALQRSDPDNDWLTELREAYDRLAFLDDGERTVRASFDLSYRSLTQQQQGFFRLLPLHPGDEISEGGAAALAQCGLAQARKVLRELRTANLLETGNRFHDLIRIYAQSHADHDPPELRAAARDRLIAHFVEECRDKQQRLLAGDAAAIGWFDEHLPAVVALISTAHGAERHRDCVALALSLAEFLGRRQRVATLLVVATTAVESARAIRDMRLECRALASLGHALMLQEAHHLALGVFTDAMSIAMSAGHLPLASYAATGVVSALIRTGQHALATAMVDDLRAMLHRLSDDSMTRIVLHHMAVALAVEELDELAAELFTEALAADSREQPEVEVGLGHTLIVLGRTNDAVASFTTAARAALAQGDHALACQAYLGLGRALLALNPANDTGHVWALAAEQAALSGHVDLIRRTTSLLEEFG